MIYALSALPVVSVVVLVATEFLCRDDLGTRVTDTVDKWEKIRRSMRNGGR